MVIETISVVTAHTSQTFDTFGSADKEPDSASVHGPRMAETPDVSEAHKRPRVCSEAFTQLNSSLCNSGFIPKADS